MRRRDREAVDLAGGFLLAGYDFLEVVARVRDTFGFDEPKARKLVRRALVPRASRRSSGWDAYQGPGWLGGGEGFFGGGCVGFSGGGDGGSFGGC